MVAKGWFSGHLMDSILLIVVHSYTIPDPPNIRLKYSNIDFDMNQLSVISVCLT